MAESKNTKEKTDPGLEKVFSEYSKIIEKISESAALLGQAAGLVVNLEKNIRKIDSDVSFSLSRRLRLKLIFGAVFSTRQQMERLVSRMETCAKSKKSIIYDIENSDPMFE